MMSLGKIVTDKDFMHFYGIDKEELTRLQQGGLDKGYFMYGENYKFSLIYSKQAKQREERNERRINRKRITRKVDKSNLPVIDIPIYQSTKRFIFTDIEQFKDDLPRGTYKKYVVVNGKEYPINTFCACMSMSLVHLRNSIKDAETFTLNDVPCKVVKIKNLRVLYNLRNNKTKNEYKHIHKSKVMELTDTSAAIFEGLNEGNTKKTYKKYTLERVMV